ncbi:MAG: ferritin-like domain-containing protein [Candidatus Dormibacter sp.]
MPEAIAGRLGRALALRSSAAVEERAIVIEHREPLIYMLCAAAELEHALMCEYLFAAFSLKRSVDEGLTGDQLIAVDRWRATILQVAKQEMMHLAINCNLVTSLGASPHLSRANLPQPAKHYPAGVRLALLPFSEQALRHFLFLGPAQSQARGELSAGKSWLLSPAARQRHRQLKPSSSRVKARAAIGATPTSVGSWRCWTSTWR